MLEICNLSVNYGKAQVLHNVDLCVKEKEIVAIIGPNGSGKTALLRTISGLLKPWQGEIKFFGERIDNLASHEIINRGIAHCPERKKLFPNMSVNDNIELGAYLRKDKIMIEKDLEKILDLFPTVKEKRNQEAKILSGGEQQMLSIARAMMSNPKLLMLDEPSLGLAPLIREKLKKIIFEINKAGVSILVVEQDLGLALSLCNRGYVFEQGRVCLKGSGEYLNRNPKVKEAYLGLA